MAQTVESNASMSIEHRLFHKSHASEVDRAQGRHGRCMSKYLIFRRAASLPPFPLFAPNQHEDAFLRLKRGTLAHEDLQQKARAKGQKK